MIRHRTIIRGGWNESEESMGSAKASMSKTKSATPSTAGLLKRIRKGAQKRAPGRPTLDEAGKLREVLIVTALHVFMQRGFEGASIESIARESKVAKITIYRQFGDKKTLFLEVARYAQSSIRARLQEAVDIDGSPESVLRNVIRRHREIATDPQYLAVLRLVVAEKPRFPEIGEAMIRETDYAMQPVVAYIERLRQAGIVVVENPSHAAVQMATLAMGGVRYLMHDPSSDPVGTERWVDSIYTTFARAWGMVPAAPPKRARSAAAL